MSEDAHQHKPIFDFQWMYCTVCLFLQSKFSEIRNEKQFTALLFHLPRTAASEDRKKCPKRPPKATSKDVSGASEDTSMRPPNPDPFKKHFLRWKPPGGFGVYLPWDLERGPQLYIDIYIYIYI